jgi:hypothetical protein
MANKLTDLLGKLVTPAGPIGEFLSPADVFKSRAGLPTSSPHTQRDGGFREVAPAALAAPQFVAKDALTVPSSRVRLVSRYVEEHYAPVYETTTSKNFTVILAASQNLLGWTVTQKARTPHCDCLQATLTQEHDGQLVHRQCGRARQRVADEDIQQHILSLQVAPADEFYNTYYPTIRGNDPVILDGKVLKGEATYNANGRMTHDGTITGGTQMRGGRSEYRRKTKGMVLWDKGVVKEREKAYAAEQKAWITGVRPRMEKFNKQMLPPTTDV